MKKGFWQTALDLASNHLLESGVAAISLLVLVLLAVFLLRRSRSGSPSELDEEGRIPDYLRKNGIVFDLFTGDVKEGILAARCMVVKVSRNGLCCETVEDIDLRGFKPETVVSCAFKPVRAGGRRINSFKARFLEVEEVNKDLVRFHISRPTAYGLAKRRRHGRKRVTDQQFVRAKIWLADPRSCGPELAQSVPDVAVNSFDARAPAQEGNEIVNLSKGGMAVRIDPSDLDRQPAQDQDVVVNLFLFNYREKMFKPYWYAGKIRAVSPEEGSLRLGIEFLAPGGLDESGSLSWQS